MAIASDDTLDWHEWPEPEPHRPPVTPHPVPLHESEPGLLDEEILPIEEDWLRGPFYTDGGSGIGVDGVIACLREYLARARKKAQIIGTIT